MVSWPPQAVRSVAPNPMTNVARMLGLIQSSPRALSRSARAVQAESSASSRCRSADASFSWLSRTSFKSTAFCRYLSVVTFKTSRAASCASRAASRRERASCRLRNFMPTSKRYRQKAVLLKDVLESQEKLASADRQRDEALLSAWTARADLERALGED